MRLILIIVIIIIIIIIIIVIVIIILIITEYKGRHDNAARYIHWQLRGKCGLERANSWYEEKPEGVVESENFQILSDFTVQCDRKIEATRPDIVFTDNKEREVVISDVAILGDDRAKGKELEKIQKYQLLKDEIAKSLAHAKSHCSACCHWGPRTPYQLTLRSTRSESA